MYVGYDLFTAEVGKMVRKDLFRNGSHCSDPSGFLGDSVEFGAVSAAGSGAGYPQMGFRENMLAKKAIREYNSITI